MNPHPEIVEQDGLEQSRALEILATRLSAETALRKNEPMSRRTTLRVGGPADLYVEPCSEADLQVVVKFCANASIPLFVLGRGSNLLVRDSGIRGVVVCLAHPSFAHVNVSGNRLECGAGARLKAVAIAAREHNLSGLEFLEGIPGSVGGALRMNAGAMGSWIFERVESVRLMNHQGEILKQGPRELAPVYRCCPTLKNNIALSAILDGIGAPGEEIRQKMDAFSSKRWSSQPASPSAGCMFKNPASIPAGKLIDELGLKGTRMGGAMVSLEHGNFIVNDRHASARDVLDLIELVKTKARTVRGITLETEVEIVGE